jgi:glycosyltransferase involved in cell wall biosynthesis
MRSIALICRFGWVGISTSVINTALFWQSKGFIVDLYTEKPDLVNFPLPPFKGKNIKVIVTQIDHKKVILEDLYFRQKYFRKERYDFVIGFDHLGLIRGGIASFFKRSILIYHSLEFFEPAEKALKSRIISKIVKFSEIFFSFKADYFFSQDTYRIKYLKRKLLQKRNKFRVIYNSPIGVSFPGNSPYFRNLFDIPESKKIVLCVGSLIKEHQVLSLLDSISTWDERFVLVLHGWIPYITVKNEILKKKNEYPQKIFISNTLFKDENKYVPFQSCDIGFVGFQPLNNNLKYAAGSAGKIFDLLRSGKPILAFDTPGMKEIIEDNETGFVFNSWDEVNLHLLTIETRYMNYVNNAITTFAKYEFSKKYDEFYLKANRMLEESDI